ncbi:uncharacterized protein BX663DRAFT_505492 [Cokeromyces recurvatus]|uniref:uncharacterized protein n=1 Tax=Cokeromyces recurvatus TaxID=90255 RepID=UPI00221F20D6|nr:uncharacterized protein BX663DRAFT_505492 [Cokeromyces recurvatus]KAI7903864.1 hypothetical protein BX663DRAFT_505492 [Cokeromyces recurvatus]
MMVGIVEKEKKKKARHYVNLYSDDEEKCLPSLRKPQTKWYMKFEPQYTDSLCDLYENKLEAVL